MKSPKTYAIVLLALTTVGGALLGWQQYRELVELRAAAMNKDERADLQKRLWDLEKLNRELQNQLAAQRGANPDDRFTAGDRPPGDGRGGRGGPDGRGGRGMPNNNPLQQLESLRKLMAKPEVQALISVQQKAAIDARYAGLFKNLNLSAEQRAKFESAVSDLQATRMDVLTAAQEQGIREPAGIRKLMADAQNDFNNNLKSVLGDAGFAQYQSYEQTMPQRNLVNQLQQRLSYTDNPLTPTQADQLVNILAANPGPRPAMPAMPAQPAGGRGPGGGGPGPGGDGGFRGGPGSDFGGGIGAVLAGGGDLGAIIGATLGGGPGGPPGGGRGGPAPVTVTPAAVNQAQGILSQPQLAALQQVQQQQQTQQQLQQIVRDTLMPMQPGPNPQGGGNAPGAGATPGAGGRKRGGG